MIRRPIDYSKYSTNQKVIWILDRLVLRMCPREIRRRPVSKQDGMGNYVRVNYIIDECSFTNTDIALPFHDMTLKVTKQMIVITSPSFACRFPPKFLNMIVNRFKLQNK